jgi:2-iminobutanoate/2-iminopropanoate deaminase
MFHSRKAPKPIGPYSQAVLIDRPGATLYVSGQIPIEVPSGRMFTGDIKRQAEIAIGHVRNIITDAGFRLDEIAKVTIYLTDLGNFDAVNAVYQELFVGGGVPARAVVGVAALPKGAGIEVEAVAVKAAAKDDLFEGL